MHTDLITTIFNNHFKISKVINNMKEEQPPKEVNATEVLARKSFEDSYLSGDYDFLKFTPDHENTFVLGYALGAAMATEKSKQILQDIQKTLSPTLERQDEK